MTTPTHAATSPIRQISGGRLPAQSIAVGSNPDGDTQILWFDADPLPFDLEVVQAMMNIITPGGAVLLMARAADVLNRTKSDV